MRGYNPRVNPLSQTNTRLFAMTKEANRRKKKTKKEDIFDFAENSTTHGVAYLLERDVHSWSRVLWFCIVVSLFALAVFMIMSLYQSWQDGPITTTVDNPAVPISEVEYPAITICGMGTIKDILGKAYTQQLRDHLVAKGTDLSSFDSDISYSLNYLYKFGWENQAELYGKKMELSPDYLAQFMNSKSPGELLKSGIVTRRSIADGLNQECQTGKRLRKCYMDATYDGKSDLCYIYSEKNMTAYEAQSSCRQNLMELFVPTSDNHLSSLATIIQQGQLPNAMNGMKFWTSFVKNDKGILTLPAGTHLNSSMYTMLDIIHSARYQDRCFSIEYKHHTNKFVGQEESCANQFNFLCFSKTLFQELCSQDGPLNNTSFDNNGTIDDDQNEGFSLAGIEWLGEGSGIEPSGEGSGYEASEQESGNEKTIEEASDNQSNVEGSGDEPEEGTGHEPSDEEASGNHSDEEGTGSQINEEGSGNEQEKETGSAEDEGTGNDLSSEESGNQPTKEGSGNELSWDDSGQQTGEGTSGYGPSKEEMDNELDEEYSGDQSGYGEDGKDSVLLSKLLSPELRPIVYRILQTESQGLHDEFENIQWDKAYHSFFELLWSSRLPCFDTGRFSGFPSENSLLKMCIWKGIRLPCSSIFMTFPSDRGMCCTFNLQKADEMLKESRFVDSINKLQERDRNESFESTTEPSWFLERQEPIAQQGVENGLTVMLDAHSSQLQDASVSEDFQGFFAAITPRRTYPLVNLNSIRIRPGHENFVAISATEVKASKSFKDKLSLNRRKCYYPDEKDLISYKEYSHPSCILECQMDLAMQQIEKSGSKKCYPWFLPNVDKNVSVCDPWQTQSFISYMKQVTVESCKGCYVDCEYTDYTTSVTAVPFRPCSNKNLGISRLCNVEDPFGPNPGIYGTQLHKEYSTDNIGEYLPKYANRFRSSSRKSFNEVDLPIFPATFEDGDNQFYDAYEEDIAMVTFYFQSPKAMQYSRQPSMSLAEFLSQIGGLLGLCLGFSFCSMAEIIYWFGVRIWKSPKYKTD